MPNNDCGLCDLLVNCGGTVHTKEQFQTLVAKLLCEGVDNLNTLAEQLATALSTIEDLEARIEVLEGA